ncbi:hypothetical protein ACFQ1L_41995 [Phytohabitans flavus]|uniref:hypothetical protein n=1 Tax=Phytohabitans flavus TaxID=1076124 RepID=UPI003630CE70
MTTVIDLGEMRPGQEMAVPEPVRTPVRWRLAWAAAGLAVLACTLGPALPERAPLTEATIPARLGDTAFAAGEQYYVVTSDRGAPPDSRTITAYTLPGATRLWQAPLPLSGALRGVGAVAGQMLISTQPELLEAVESVSIREATGQIMWRRRALFEGVTAGGRVLLWTSLDGTPAGSTGRETLEAVDPVTGAVHWAYRVPVGGWLSYRYRARRPPTSSRCCPRGGSRCATPRTGGCWPPPTCCRPGCRTYRRATSSSPATWCSSAAGRWRRRTDWTASTTGGMPRSTWRPST